MAGRCQLLSADERGIYSNTKGGPTFRCLRFAANVSWADAFDASRDIIARNPELLGGLLIRAVTCDEPDASGPTLAILYEIWSIAIAKTIKSARVRCSSIPTSGAADKMLAYSADRGNVFGTHVAIMMGACNLLKALHHSVIHGKFRITKMLTHLLYEQKIRGAMCGELFQTMDAMFVLAAKHDRVKTLSLLLSSTQSHQAAFECACLHGSHRAMRYLLRRRGRQINFEEAIWQMKNNRKGRQILIKYLNAHPGNEELIAALNKQ